MFPSPVFYSLKDLCQLFWTTPGSIDIFLSLQRNSYTVANSLKLTSFFIISFLVIDPVTLESPAPLDAPIRIASLQRKVSGTSGNISQNMTEENVTSVSPV